MAAMDIPSRGRDSTHGIPTDFQRFKIGELPDGHQASVGDGGHRTSLRVVTNRVAERQRNEPPGGRQHATEEWR